MAADATVAKILDGLNESADQARAQVAAVIDALGEQVALDLCDQTIHIEANGGMPLPDGGRRRTPSGVFLKLVRNRLSPVQRRTIFEDLPESLRRAQRPAPAPPMPPRASTEHVVLHAAHITQLPRAKSESPAAQWTTAPVQKLVLLQDVLPAPSNGELSRDAEPSPTSSEEPVDRRSKRRARAKVRRNEHPELDSQPHTEPLVATTLRARLDATHAASFEDRVQALVDAFVDELVPLLRESVMQQIRDALGGPEQTTDVPVAARQPREQSAGHRRNRLR